MVGFGNLISFTSATKFDFCFESQIIEELMSFFGQITEQFGYFWKILAKWTFCFRIKTKREKHSNLAAKPTTHNQVKNCKNLEPWGSIGTSPSWTLKWRLSSKSKFTFPCDFWKLSFITTLWPNHRFANTSINAAVEEFLIQNLNIESIPVTFKGSELKELSPHIEKINGKLFCSDE